MVHPSQQNPPFVPRRATITVTRKGRSRVYTLRPWLVASALTLAAGLSGALLGAAGYLVYRDDLLGGSLSRQVAMQYSYEDRIAALRTEIDRVSSYNALQKQTLEGQLGTLLQRQAVLERRQSDLDDLADQARASGVDVSTATRLPRPRPALAAVAPVATPEADPDMRLGYAADEASSADVITGTVLRSGNHDDASAKARETLKPLLSNVQSSLDAIEGAQTAELDALSAASAAKTEHITGVMASIGVRPALAETDDPVGGPFIPVKAGMHFVERTALLQRTLSDLDTLQRQAGALPIRKPLPSDTRSSGFGYRTDPFLGRPALHAGIDFVAAAGSDVHATAPGTVVSAGWSGGYGNMVELRHAGGLSTRYGHLSQILVTPGMTVAAGAVLGRVGSTGRSTGPHLHYETRRDGEAVDPSPFLAAARAL